MGEKNVHIKISFSCSGKGVSDTSVFLSLLFYTVITLIILNVTLNLPCFSGDLSDMMPGPDTFVWMTGGKRLLEKNSERRVFGHNLSQWKDCILSIKPTNTLQ